MTSCFFLFLAATAGAAGAAGDGGSCNVLHGSSVMSVVDVAMMLPL